MTNRARFVKSCLDFAVTLERKKFPMHRIGRSTVFRTNGSAGDVTGLVIERAGLKPKMRPYRGISFDGAMGVKWWDVKAAIRHVTGSSIREDLADDLQVANDVYTGEDRRTRIVKALRQIAAELS